jgi:hypothetical protein
MRDRIESTYDLAGMWLEGSRAAWDGLRDMGFDCTGSGGRVSTDTLESARGRCRWGCMEIPGSVGINLWHEEML